MDYEKLGVFYLGKEDSGELLLYDAKDLTTHALCVGMTGSGKTGLCITLLEEAAIDGIPALIIDPKGDMGNLLLRFPELDAKSFQPWIEPAEAARKGSSVEEYAKKTAEKWAGGIAEWDQEPDRIRRLMEAAEVRIYTPGSNAGVPITVLRSFAAPPAAVREQRETFSDRIESAVSGLLALLDIEADPIQSRETILLSNILQSAWSEGRDLDLPQLIREVLKPPFSRLGVFDLESFYPEKDRSALAMALNGLIASPSFSAWLEGEPLEIPQLLYRKDGRPRHSIFSIAHLSDRERMFFVTTLLNELVSWMRTQSGTSSLRAIFYMDEIFGYFPPTREPPSKKPMLTLLKQARAFGVGCVLATQNPVDLDYKGLSNCGTWFLGRLQTERDKMRVLDGLEGAMSDAGRRGFDRAKLDATLSGLGSRRFLLNNVHEDGPVVFQTRWALSYLRGPLTREQIRTLMAPVLEQQDSSEQRDIRQATSPRATDEATSVREPRSKRSKKQGGSTDHAVEADAVEEELASTGPGNPTRPILGNGVTERFLPARLTAANGEVLLYQPALCATGRLHFVRAREQLDTWASFRFVAGLVDDADPLDMERSVLTRDPPSLEWTDEPLAGARFSTVPPSACKASGYRSFAKRIKSLVYQGETMELYKCKELKLVSAAGESEQQFRSRVTQEAREARDLAVEKLRKKFAPKMQRAKESIRKAREKLGREEEQLRESQESTAVRFGQSLLGALFGRKLASSANVSRAGTAVRAAQRTRKEKQDIARAKRDIEAQYEKMNNLETELQEAIEELEQELSPSELEIETVTVRSRKSDLVVDDPVLLWTPWIVRRDNTAEPAFAPETLGT